jgi:hypothetical protein
MKASGFLIVGILIVAAILAITAMLVVAAPYIAVVVVIAFLAFLASKIPEPEKKKEAPPKWPHDPNDFRQ